MTDKLFPLPLFDDIDTVTGPGCAVDIAQDAHIAAKQAQPVVREREAFEVFAQDCPMGKYSVTRRGEGYDSSHTQLMRDSWQAALRWAATNQVPVVGEPSDDMGRLFYELSWEAWGIAPKWALLNQDERDRNREAAKKFCTALALRSQPGQATRAEREAEQRGRMAERFAKRAATPATADFDLPAQSDEYQVVQAEPVASDPEQAMLEVIDERDRIHEWVDQLADAIAKHTGRDIGEHTSVNNPWRMALNALEAHERLDAKAHPAPTPQAVPMTDERLAEVLTTAYGSPELTMADVRAARAVEAAAHGITQPVQVEKDKE